MRNCSMFLLYVLVVVFAVLVAGSESSVRECEKKEKSLALLELTKDAIIKAKELIPDCEEDKNTSHPNKSSCGKKEKMEAYLDVALELIEKAKNKYPTCDSGDEKPVLSDCQEFLEQGWTKSGVYTIRPQGPAARENRTFDVYCDMETEGGGWTVIQRRGNFTPKVDFYRDWNAYKEGFGSVARDFWLGNEKIHMLSNQGHYNVRIDLEDVDGVRKHDKYSKFRTDNEQNMYKLNMGLHLGGDAGESMQRNSGKYFNTKDKGESSWDGQRCAEYKESGWWFFSGCTDFNPNGKYMPGVKDEKSVYYASFRGNHGLASVEIKLKRDGPLVHA